MEGKEKPKLERRARDEKLGVLHALTAFLVLHVPICPSLLSL